MVSIYQKLASFWVLKKYFIPFHQEVSTHDSYCPRSRYASCPQRPGECYYTIIKGHFPLLRDVFTPPCPPPRAPVLCLWCYSWSWGPRLPCRCGSRTARNHMTGRCCCWLGGSPCLVAALTCTAGRVVSSGEAAFQHQHLNVWGYPLAEVAREQRWHWHFESNPSCCWCVTTVIAMCSSCDMHSGR